MAYTVTYSQPDFPDTTEFFCQGLPLLTNGTPLDITAWDEYAFWTAQGYTVDKLSGAFTVTGTADWTDAPSEPTGP